MIRLPPDFLDLLTALNAADAKYLLVGGHAVGFHGVPRLRRRLRRRVASTRTRDLADVEALERQASHKSQ
jgi:hypothetical protein